MPVIVGTKKEINVHLKLWVSFFIVKHVVLHGQCISENNITHTSVSHVHPLDTYRFLSSDILSNSNILPVAM